ncbi:MAG: acyl-CoA desaturase [Cytophagales bacterium]
MQLPIVKKTTKLKFLSPKNQSFFSTLKSRVDQHFKSNQKSKTGDWPIVVKSCFFIGGFLGIYFILLFSNQSSFINLILISLMGMFGAFIGFNVSHDAIHGSFSNKNWINNLMKHSFYLIGANPYIWKITHNHMHHTYTNIQEHDEDLDIAPGLIRLKSNDPLKFIHRFQKYYAIPLYGFASMSWVVRKDFKKMFSKSLLPANSSHHPKIEYFNLFFFKALYWVFFAIVPMLVLDISIWQWLIAFLVFHLSQGLVLGLVFQLAHVVEGLQFPEPDENGYLEETWAIHQMQTTANFGTQNRLLSFFCGGLNHQIEHHLFPNISHIHYAELSKIVKATAAEFNVPYFENKSFTTALISHYNMLNKLGKS